MHKMIAAALTRSSMCMLHACGPSVLVPQHGSIQELFFRSMVILSQHIWQGQLETCSGLLGHVCA